MKIDLALSIALDTTQNPNPLMSNQKDVYAANTDAEGARHHCVFIGRAPLLFTRWQVVGALALAALG